MSARRAEAARAAASAAEEAARVEKEAERSYGQNKAQRAADKVEGAGTGAAGGAAGGAEEGDSGEGEGEGTFKLVGDEDRKVGVVSAGVWARLLLAAGWWLTVPVVLLYWGGSVLQQGSSAWLKIWVEDSVAPFLHTEYYYIAVFAALSLAVVFIIFIRTLTKTFASARLSLTVHTSALTNVFNAPMSWFEATKVGRLINRFSSDLGKLDWSVLDNVMGFVWSLSSALAMLLLVVLYSWYSLLVFGPLLVLYYFMQRTCVALTVPLLYRRCTACTTGAARCTRDDQLTRPPPPPSLRRAGTAPRRARCSASRRFRARRSSTRSTRC